MMGVGKTTVGRLLARRLGWAFWDNDAALADATGGQTAADVQAASGTDALHALEHRLLAEALAARTHTVFAAPGSVVLAPEALAGALTVWLRSGPGSEAARIAASRQRHRPLPPNPATALRRLESERRPLYAALADASVEVEGGADATCERVLAAVRNRII